MSGPLAGLQGILVKRKNKTRFVVSVERIQRAIAVEMNEADLEPVRWNAVGSIDRGSDGII